MLSTIITACFVNIHTKYTRRILNNRKIAENVCGFFKTTNISPTERYMYIHVTTYKHTLIRCVILI